MPGAGGIHGGETVVERHGNTEYENGFAPPRRRSIVYSFATASLKRLSILCTESAAMQKFFTEHCAGIET